ncbi:hypothetical protein VpaJT1_32 [Vibrio phage VpaJT_1]|nr:hypothetical protein VpaJT1_32 [Vibrio phage VpaJT_1]
MLGLKQGLYRAEKGQEVPVWMYEVYDKDNDTVLPNSQYSFEFRAPCKIYIGPDLKTYIAPIKPMNRCKQGVMGFKHLGSYMLNGGIRFRPNHNHIFGAVGLRHSAVRVLIQCVKIKNRARVPNIREASL